MIGVVFGETYGYSAEAAMTRRGATEANDVDSGGGSAAMAAEFRALVIEKGRSVEQFTALESKGEL